MKKIASIFLSVVLLMTAFIIPGYEEFYASPALSMSISSSSVIIGDTVTTTVTVPSGYGAQVDIRFSAGVLSYLEASTSNVNATNVGNGQVSLNMYEALGTSTVTVKFKAVSSGTATIEAVVVKAGDANGDEVQLSGASKSVTVANQAVQDPEKSDDNSLATLKLSSGTLSPAFKYNVTNYTATVDYDVSRVDITAKTSNEKAVIESMSGNESLKVGENLITIVVKAESGETATYKIVVTRKAQETGGENPGTVPSESEDNSENTTGNNTEDNTEQVIEGADSGFTMNGTPLLLTETIPTEVIPADFSQETMMFDNMEIPCLSSQKGAMTLLYLKTAEGNGALYIYDKVQESVYPFIKLQSNDRYIIVLQPEELSAPEGYEMCSLSIEGKGVVTACSYKAEDTGENVAEFSDFYLLYCVNNEGNLGWYQYDTIEGTFQRFTGIKVVDSSEEPSGNTSVEEPDSNNELEAELKEEQNKNRMMLCVFIFVVAVLLVVIMNLILNRRIDDEEEEFEEDELEEEDLEGIELTEGNLPIVGEVVEPEVNAAVEGFVVVEDSTDEIEFKFDDMPEETHVADEDDDIELEYQKLSEKLMEEAITKETMKTESSDDDDLEFIDLL